MSHLSFLNHLSNLKHLPRAGWMTFDINNVETVASHSMRVAMIALLLPNTYNISKCIEIGLIHDIAESIVGDITPS